MNSYIENNATIPHCEVQDSSAINSKTRGGGAHILFLKYLKFIFSGSTFVTDQKQIFDRSKG